MVKKMSIGHKDLSKSLFSVWNDIFTQSTSRSKTKHKNLSGGGLIVGLDGEVHGGTRENGKIESDSGRYFHRLVSNIHGCGEYERLMMGCFENYLQCRVIDTIVSGSMVGIDATIGPESPKLVQMLEWVEFFDTIHFRVQVKHEYELAGYQPLAMVACHRLFASPSQSHKIEYPRMDYQAFLATKMASSILSGFREGWDVRIKQAWSCDLIMTDMMPHLLKIISPKVKSVRVRLFFILFFSLKTHSKLSIDRRVFIKRNQGNTGPFNASRKS